MKKLWWFAGMTFLVISPAIAVPPEVDIPPLEFVPGTAERFVLTNGAVVYLLEDHELPLFNMNVLIKVSPADETVRESLDLLDTVWRTGGTKSRPPDALNDELERIAASVETSADIETVTISLTCLSKDIPKGIAIFSDVLLNPAFNAEQLSLAQAKTVENLRRKNETPQQIARRAFRDVVYGKDHVYAREPEEASVNRVKRTDLAALHKKVVVPDRAVIAMAGDFNKAEMLASLESALASWPATGRLVPTYDYSVKSPRSEMVFAVNKAAAQSRITIGRVGPARHNPDHFPLQLADYIFGGSGPSRLFGEIRSRLGLAYVVGSFVQETAGPGLLGVACQTKAASTVAAVQAILRELDSFSTGSVRPEEIKLAKEAIVNSFVFGFDSPWDVVNARASNEFYGFPPDYPDMANARVRAVTAADIAKVAKRYYNKDAMKIMMVGDESKFDPPLDALGPVTRIPLSDVR